jgi:hypothetical protein
MLSPYYHGKEFEYPTDRGKPGDLVPLSLPDPRLLFESAEVLTGGLRGFCGQQTRAMSRRNR